MAKGYSYAERGAYHARVAKKGSKNPDTGKEYSPEQRAYSRGWLTKQKQSNKAYNFNKKYKKKA